MGVPRLYQNWNNDLKTTDSNVKWKECLHVTNSITTNENLRLIQYKLMTRIYYTKSKVHKFDPSSSALCIKCLTEEDTLIHTFWECPAVNQVWMEIEKCINTVCRATIHLTPQLCILHNTEQVRYPLGWQICFCSLIYKKKTNFKTLEEPCSCVTF